MQRRCCDIRLLDLLGSVPAFGEEVGIWRSRDKKQAKAAHHKGALGLLIAESLDPRGNGTSVLIAKGSDVQDSELNYCGAATQHCSSGLSTSLRLSKPRFIPAGWDKNATDTLAHRWKTVHRA